jgi:hypothetical protein
MPYVTLCLFAAYMALMRAIAMMDLAIMVMGF